MVESRSGTLKIPRRHDDDFAPEVIGERRALAEKLCGRSLAHLFGATVPADEARGNIENWIGASQVPLGIAGPLTVDTSVGSKTVLVPMATTEGAVVASYSRGMRLLSEADVRSRVVHEGLTQNPILVYANAAEAQAGLSHARNSFEVLRDLVSTTTNHGALVKLDGTVLGRRLILTFMFTTGDAIGINMAARATDLCIERLERETGARARYVHGQDLEKRANTRALIEGRGRSVVCDARIPRELCKQRLRATPERLVEIWKSYIVGYAQLGTQNWTVQTANGLAAIFTACGQDIAYVTECATGHLDFDIEGEDLYASLTLPSLLVGTVGGGSGQGTARECLELLGCYGAGKANRFAEVIGAALLAGDLSLMASFCMHEFVAAHEHLGRNRPKDA